MRIVILQNGSRVVGRYSNASEAKDRVLQLVEKFPAAIYEVCIVTRRVYTEAEDRPKRRLVDEVVN